MRLYLLVALWGLTLLGTTACDTVRSGVDSTLGVFSSEGDNPAGVVTMAYGYQITPGAALPPPWSKTERQKYFSKRLITLLIAHETPGPNGKPGLHFEFDPFVNAEEGEVTEFSTSLMSQDESATQVRASFRNKGKPTSMVFVMVQEEEGWRIDDVKSLDGEPKWVLSSLLKPE